MSSSKVLLAICFIGSFCLSFTLGAAVEKREMPSQVAPQGGYGGGYGGGGYDQGGAGSYGSPPPPPQGQPPFPPFGFKDPGFSVQTGFEGFLVSIH